MSSEAQTSYHGIAARLDRIPITGMHRKVLWLLAGITFCDSVDMGVGGPIGAVLQSTYDAAGNQWMTLEQFALFNSITMIGYRVVASWQAPFPMASVARRRFSSAVLSSPYSASLLQAPPTQRS